MRKNLVCSVINQYIFSGCQNFFSDSFSEYTHMIYPKSKKIIYSRKSVE